MAKEERKTRARIYSTVLQEQKSVKPVGFDKNPMRFTLHTNPVSYQKVVNRSDKVLKSFTGKGNYVVTFTKRRL